MDITTVSIPDSQLKAAAQLGNKAFVQVFMDKYLQITGPDLSAEKLPLLNGNQHALLSYKIMRDELTEGGFLQLIQDGYGPYIFENPFAKAMRVFGAPRLAQLIYKAEHIYNEHKADLTAYIDTDAKYDHLMDTYSDKFEQIENEIFVLEEDFMEAIAHYIDEHIADFAQISAE